MVVDIKNREFSARINQQRDRQEFEMPANRQVGYSFVAILITKAIGHAGLKIDDIKTEPIEYLKPFYFLLSTHFY